MKQEQIEELKQLLGGVVAQSLFPEPIVIPRKTAHFLSAAHNALPTLLREREQLIEHLRASIHAGCGAPNRSCSDCAGHIDAIAKVES